MTIGVKQIFDVIVRFDNRDEMFCKPITKMSTIIANDYNEAILRAWNLTYMNDHDTPVEVFNSEIGKWITRR